MPFGRKKANPVKIAPSGPAVLRTRTGDGQGNLSTSEITPDGTLLTDTQLSPERQALGQLSQRNLTRLATELSQGGTATDRDTARRLSESTYTSLSRTINGESSAQRDLVRSELSRRFGGTTAATFGNELLARVEGERLGSLSQARAEADAAGADQLRDLENARIQRLSVFSKLVEGNSSLAAQLNSRSSSLFQTERSRRQSKSLAVANLRQRYIIDREKIAQQREKAYLQLAGSLFKSASSAAAGGM